MNGNTREACVKFACCSNPNKVCCGSQVCDCTCENDELMSGVDLSDTAMMAAVKEDEDDDDEEIEETTEEDEEQWDLVEDEDDEDDEEDE